MFTYKEVTVHYKEYGNVSGNPVFFLHGWGQNISMMEPLVDSIKDTHHIFLLDLPGFGESSIPTYPWTLEDYVDMLHCLVKQLHFSSISLVGHSFGGKISLLYASMYSVSYLVLLASPYCVKYKKQPLRVRFYKKVKKIPFLKPLASFMRNKIGSTDYKNASPIMRAILVQHVNTDLTEKAKKIKCPTFLIWGSRDDAVPVSDAERLEKIIPDCGLCVYEGCTHYAYLENLNRTKAILKAFIK